MSINEVIDTFTDEQMAALKKVTMVTTTTAADVDFYPLTTTNIMENFYPDWTVVDSYQPPRIEELHNCNNCGGSIDEKGYCRYCGSRVYFFG